VSVRQNVLSGSVDTNTIVEEGSIMCGLVFAPVQVQSGEKAPGRDVERDVGELLEYSFLAAMLLALIILVIFSDWSSCCSASSLLITVLSGRMSKPPRLCDLIAVSIKV
jgi:hypothetical protein